jgi:hypothetical protein
MRKPAEGRAGCGTGNQVVGSRDQEQHDATYEGDEPDPAFAA